MVAHFMSHNVFEWETNMVVPKRCHQVTENSASSLPQFFAIAALRHTFMLLQELVLVPILIILAKTPRF